MRDSEREKNAETQVEGEAGSVQEAWRGTRSRVSKITPWAEGSAKPLSHLGCPTIWTSNIKFPNDQDQRGPGLSVFLRRS